MTIYLAGPLFTGGERAWNAALAAVIRDAGHTVFLPQEGAESRLRDRPKVFPAQELFDDAIQGIRRCDVVVAIMDGPDPDSGTCFECGFAYALDRPIIGVRSDLRPGGDDTDRPVNLMLARSVQALVRADGLRGDARVVGEQVLEALASLSTR